MVSLASLEKLVIKSRIDEWVEKNYIFIDREGVTIIDEDTYYELMRSILYANPEYFDEFIKETSNEALMNYFIFLKMILEGKLEESRPLMIKLIRDKVFLNDYEEILLYVSIIEEYTLNDLYIPEEENELVRDYITVFKKHLLAFNYPLAKEMFDKVRRIHDCIEYRVIDEILKSKKDKIKYILDEDIYPSKVTRDNLKRMERSALCELELGNYTKFAEIINKLDQIYQNQDRMPFKIMIMLLNAMKYLECNKSNVSGRSFLTFHGKLDAVLVALITCQDYYRVQDVIEEEIKKCKQFDIYLAIIYCLIYRINILNKRNRDNWNKRISNDKKIVLDEMPKDAYLSRIDGNMIKSKEGKKKMESNNIDFYEAYKKAYRDGKYREARINLLRFIKNLRSFGINPYFEHLFKELDYLEKNALGDASTLSLCMSDARKNFIEGKYEETLAILTKWQEGATYFHPRVNALMAKCLYKLGKLEEALELYKKCEEYYLYPLDYEDIIMILYHLNRWDEIEPYYELRENNDYASLKITYMMSVIELNKGHYKQAKKYLKLIEERCPDLYEVTPDFTKEKEIIKKASHGENVKYTLDDYIEYGITEDDAEVVKLIDEYKEQYGNDYLKMLFITIQNLKESLNVKIDYLLTVVRVLKNRHEEVSKDISDYIDYLLSLDDLDKTNKERFTIMKKNYQNL